MKWLKNAIVAGQSVIVYLATLLGILLSQFAPLLLTHGPINTTFQWIRLFLSMGMAFYIVVGQEEGGDSEGKRKNFKRRVANAVSHGFTWNGLIGLSGQAAGQ